MSYAVSWSGGKDACFGYFKAIKEGCEVSHLLNNISDDYRRVRFHGSEAEMIQLQAKAMQLPLIQNETAAQNYARQYKQIVRGMISDGIDGIIFGDIFVRANRDFAERICTELGIKAMFPLWGSNTEELFLEFIDAGFEAIVTGAIPDFDRRWIGHGLDLDLLNYLKDKGFDSCGENGEYHTLVLSGPLFKQKIEISKCKPVTISGFQFLDTIEYAFSD